MLTSIAVNLKNIHQHITNILPFDFNHDFCQFPNFIEMHQPTCDCEKNSINVYSFDMCSILSNEMNTNHVGIKRNTCILSVTFFMQVYASKFKFM